MLANNKQSVRRVRKARSSFAMNSGSFHAVIATVCCNALAGLTFQLGGRSPPPHRLRRRELAASRLTCRFGWSKSLIGPRTTRRQGRPKASRRAAGEPVDGADRRRRARNPQAVRAIEVRFPSIWSRASARSPSARAAMCRPGRTPRAGCCCRRARRRGVCQRAGASRPAPAPAAAADAGLVPVTAPDGGQVLRRAVARPIRPS